MSNEEVRRGITRSVLLLSDDEIKRELFSILLKYSEDELRRLEDRRFSLRYLALKAELTFRRTGEIVGMGNSGKRKLTTEEEFAQQRYFHNQISNLQTSIEHRRRRLKTARFMLGLALSKACDDQSLRSRREDVEELENAVKQLEKELMLWSLKSGISV